MLSVLVNPRARGVRRDADLPRRLAAIAAGLGELVVTEADRLPALAAELACRAVPLVAVCGGDGTGQAVLTELCTAYRDRGRPPPQIALLRGGTVNTVTRNLGLRGSPEQLLARLCDRVRAGTPLPTSSQQLLSVDGRLGFLFAAALGARFLELYYETPEPTLFDAARLAARVVASALVRGPLAERLFRPTALSISLGDRPALRLEAARLVVASTVPDMGLGMRICPRARDAPGQFQLVASGLAPNLLARQLSAVRAGRALTGSPHHDLVVAAARLEFDEEQPYTVDGELFRARSVTLTVGPRIQLVRA